MLLGRLKKAVHLFDVVSDGSLVAFGHQLLDLEINVDEIEEKLAGQIPVDDLEMCQETFVRFKTAV